MKTHEFVDKYCSYLIILIMSLGLFSCSSGCNTTSNNVANETVIMDSSDGGIADGATNVSLTPSIVLKFSKSMDPTSINNTTITLTDNLSSNLTNKTKQVNNIAIGNIIANADNTKFIFSPESALLANTKYFVKINQAKTSQGIYVSGSFSFTTSSGGVIAPMVSLVTPDNQGINVAISPYITVTFSESVVNVNSDNVWLYQASDAGNKVNLQLIAESGNSYTFAPSSNLSASTNYILAFNTTKIVDLDGNQLTAESFSFTTKNPQWQQMGESLLIPSNIQNADISFANNIPYIAYIDDNNKSSVIQFNYTSNTWQFIGESNLANNVSRVKLAIDPSNSDIYLAYLDDSNNVNI
ncbi:MAG: hypothetical protein RLZZ293_973, partial [Pseudomonadota bacterium]